MEERIQKILSAAGLMSRRSAEKAIQDGRVTVNGNTAILGEKADPETDVICLDGKKVTQLDRKVYIMLNKPAGFVTTLSDEKGRKNVSELVKGAGIRVYPVGRLDMFSEGLLILTNDGDFANLLMHPSHGFSKTYETFVTGDRLSESIRHIPVITEIEGQSVHPAQVETIQQTEDSAVLQITISEGRNRQVRKLCEMSGLKVNRLVRIREGSLTLDGLEPGHWRYLTQNELKQILEVS